MSRKDEKTAQILQAATQEFLKKGLDAASMHNIAVVAGVSKRTLYKYYSSKDELFHGLVDELLDRVYEMYKITYNPGESIKGQLEEIVANKIKFITSESFINISKIVIGEMIKSKKVTEQQVEKMASSDTLFVTWINEARIDGQVTSQVESEDIANQFHNLVKGEVFWPVLLGITNRESIDTRKVSTMAVTFFINSFCK
jgi:TetR/AcrR family transcriptional regulator of autoinduction and epiphytic fitness